MSMSIRLHFCYEKNIIMEIIKMHALPMNITLYVTFLQLEFRSKQQHIALKVVSQQF